jgi:hypothetical protein
MLRRRLTMLGRARHFENLLVVVNQWRVWGSMELICSKCGSDVTPLLCISTPLLTPRTPRIISSQYLDQGFALDFSISFTNHPGSTPGRCLMYDREAFKPLATSDQYPASAIKDLPPAGLEPSVAESA